MTKIHFQNLRSKKFPDKKSKIWKCLFFLNWLFEEKNFEKKSSQSQFKKINISNFRFFVRKMFQIFSISNFENGFSSWKINSFHPNFFSRTKYERLLSIPHVYTATQYLWEDGAKENHPNPLISELPGSFRERLHMWCVKAIKHVMTECVSYYCARSCTEL